jgi:hypothetical protein
MADLLINLTETIKLNGESQTNTTSQIVSGINYVDNRSLKCPSGSQTTIFYFGSEPSAGTFKSSSFQYGRITNLSNTSIKLIVSSSTIDANFLVSSSNSFLLSTSKITGSIDNSFTFEEIHSVLVEPSGSDANIEYFIATT